MFNTDFIFKTVIPLLISPSPTGSSLFVLMFLNILISAMVSYFIAYHTLSHLVNKRKPFFFFLLSLGAFIPILGILCILLGTFFLRNYKNTAIEIYTVSQIDYIKKKAVKTIPYAAGWSRIRLESPHFNKMERQQALRSISKTFQRETNIIFKKLLSDEMDELRLYAFGLLENQLDFFNKKINQLLRSYQRSSNKLFRAKIEKQLALLNWEMIYLNLAGDELKDIIIDQCHDYAQKALCVLSEDTALWLLVSKIDLQRGDTRKSIEELIMADHFHAPQSKTYPFFAEYYFKTGDYNKVREYLSMDISLQDIPKLGKIVEFWRQNDKT